MPMASRTLLLLLLTFLAAAAGAAAADVAPGPSSSASPHPHPQLNLTGILEKGGQYTTLLRLLKSTQVSEQLGSQLRDSYDGLTVFAPTDYAFSKLRPGTLNGLTDQQQVQLVLYHVLPRYYSLTTFQTASNPLRTQASGAGGVYTVNVTSAATAGQAQAVDVSTGAVVVPVGNALYAEFPLALYSLDGVLLPAQLFGGKHAAAPAPGSAASAGGGDAAGRTKKGAPKSDVAAEPSASGAEAEDSKNDAAAGRVVGWSAIVSVALTSFANLVFF